MMVSIDGLENVMKDKMEYKKELNRGDTRINRAKAKALECLFKTPRVSLDYDGINTELTIEIYRKKINQIKEARSSEDLKLILMPPKVVYNGCEVVPANKWVLPEEELIVWSNTSLTAPLSQEGFDRYMKVFKEVFPQAAKELEMSMS